MVLSERKSFFLVFVFLFIFSLFLYWGERAGFLVGLRGFLSRPFVALSSPFNAWALKVDGFCSFVISWPSREKEVLSLREQLAGLSVDQGELIACQSENQRLKDLLSSPLPPSWKFVEARVINWGENLRINRGKASLIEEGMTVLFNDVLVGQVIKANQFDSLVELVDKRGVKIPVGVKGKDSLKEVKAKGLLIGSGRNHLRLEKVLQEEKLVKGDLVFSLGQGGILPDLIVGRIDEISDDKTAVYQSATVLPLVDYQRLRQVFVVYEE